MMMMKETICTSETLAYFNNTARCFIQEGCHLQEAWCYNRSLGEELSTWPSEYKTRVPTTTLQHLFNLDVSSSQRYSFYLITRRQVTINKDNRSHSYDSHEVTFTRLWVSFLFSDLLHINLAASSPLANSIKLLQVKEVNTTIMWAINSEIANSK
jgi:hypothetical protein